MKRKNNISGTTLVEVVVASALILIMSGTVALALSTVFDGYMNTQKSGSIEQDSEIILSRLKYAINQHDDNLVRSFGTLSDLKNNTASMTGTRLIEGEDSRVELSDGALSGSYKSKAIVFDSLSRVNSIIFIGTSATKDAALKLQLALYKKEGDACSDTNENFVGPDKTSSSWFTGYKTEGLLESLSGQYLNPAECLRVFVDFSRTNNSVESPKFFGIEIKK
ncbi:MAG: hypothetical protein U0525_01900 [Patescibacteria group bacterium]